MFLNLDENILRKAPEDMRRLMFRPPDIWSVNVRRPCKRNGCRYNEILGFQNG